MDRNRKCVVPAGLARNVFGCNVALHGARALAPQFYFAMKSQNTMETEYLNNEGLPGWPEQKKCLLNEMRAKSSIR